MRLAPSEKFQFEFPSGSTQLWVGSGLLSRLPELDFKAASQKAYLFCDPQLSHAGETLARSLSSQGWATTLIPCPSGEQLKDFQALYPLYGKLLAAGADRQSTLFALGGGAMGDAIGFLAGTFQRGVRWVGIPTTLLAQVDSCLGGKTGINHEKGKNLIGLFHQPSVVLCDLEFLKTLPQRELVSGLGEIFKYGLIFDASFFALLARDWQKVLNHDPSLLMELVSKCLNWKAQRVVQDERDILGLREVLNFGHTVGHALEAEAGYGSLRHGEAVILGMRAAIHLSVLRGHLDSAVARDVEQVLVALPVPRPQGLKYDRLLQRIQADKKSRNGRVRFVLLKKLGEPILDEAVQEGQILQALEFIL